MGFDVEFLAEARCRERLVLVLRSGQLHVEDAAEEPELESRAGRRVWPLLSVPYGTRSEGWKASKDG